MKKQRDFSIDVLRFTGLIFIILCHVGPPETVFNLRNFDVSMLVFASGLSFAAQGRDYLGSGQDYLGYIRKRLKRLLLPTWIFLIAYYVLFNLIGILMPDKGISFSTGDYVLSFSLISGIGYVWVFRVYILMAIASPFLYASLKKCRSWIQRTLIVVGMVVAQEALVLLIGDRTGIGWMLVKHLIAYMLGYGIIMLAGMLAYQAKNKHLILAGGGILGIFLSGFCISGYPELAAYKYPPRLLYTSYGLGISLIVLYVCRILSCSTMVKANIVKQGKLRCIRRLVTWVSKNSLTIYYAHIFVVSAKGFGLYRLPADNWITRLVFVCVISSILAWGYLKAKSFVAKKYIKIDY